MVNLDELRVNYVTDEQGRRTSVLIPVEQFERLVEDIADLAVVAKRREEATVSHEQVFEELRRDGLCD